jgi:hypothetical protein
MRTYQLILRSGLTRNIEATGYTKGRQGLVIMMADGTILCLKKEAFLRIDEVHDDGDVVNSTMPGPVVA